MARKKSIGATLVLNNGNFFTNARKAAQEVTGLKGKLQSLIGQNDKISKSNTNLGNNFGSVAKKIAGAAAGIASAGAIKNLITDSVNGVMELERANTRLETLMMNVSGTTKAQVQDLIEYGDALELCTTIEGDATMAGASQLATFQLSADTIKTLLPAFQDLAVAQYGVNVSQEQMIQSGNLIGKVMNGSTGALTKAGVSFTEAQEKILKTGTESEKAAALVDVLGKNFGGLAQKMAQTDEGKIRQLKNAWGSVKDEIGFALLPVVSNTVSYFAAHIPQMRDAVSGFFGKIQSLYNACRPSIENLKNAFFDVGARIKEAFGNINTGDLGAAIQNLLPDVINFAAKVVEYFGKIGAFAINELPKYAPLLAGIAGALGAIKLSIVLTSAATKILNLVASMNPFSWIAMAVAGLVVLYQTCEPFRNAVNAVAKTIANAFVQAWELIKAVWDKVKPFFSGIWEHLKINVEFTKTVLSGAFQMAWARIQLIWTAASGFFMAVWNTIAGIFSVVKDVLTGNWQGAWDGIKGIVGTWKDYFASVWESIKNVFSKTADFFKDTFKAAGKAIKEHITNAINGAIKLMNKVPGVNIPTISSDGNDVPGLATGGIINRSGTVLVGERGPEFLNLPQGARVTPLERAANNNNINIYVYGSGNVDDTVNQVAMKLKLALANL